MINLNMTQEERTEMLEKARAAREKKKELFISESHLLKSSFADKNHWRKLASKFQVRFPADYVPGSEVKLSRRAMRKSGVSPEIIKDRLGMDIKAFAEQNSTWPAYAIIGIILEIADEIGNELAEYSISEGV